MGFWDRKTVVVTGGGGFVGSHLVRRLRTEHGVTGERLRVPRRQNCDLTALENCRRAVQGGDIVLHLAAVVGGINYNREHPAFSYTQNTLLNTYILEASRLEGVEKVVLVSSACAYPQDAPVPLREDDLFKGAPEETNASYGFAKRMMVVQARAYRAEYGMNVVTAIPFNAYGPGDNFDSENSHVIPALIAKCYQNRELVVWGDGTPTRNFLFVEDFVTGLLLVAERLDTGEIVNIGTDEETSIKEAVELIVKYTGFRGPVCFNPSKPGGQPRRAADISRARHLLGYDPKHSFKVGLEATIAWYRDEVLGGRVPPPCSSSARRHA